MHNLAYDTQRWKLMCPQKVGNEHAQNICILSSNVLGQARVFCSGIDWSLWGKRGHRTVHHRHAHNRSAPQKCFE